MPAAVGEVSFCHMLHVTARRRLGAGASMSATATPGPALTLDGPDDFLTPTVDLASLALYRELQAHQRPMAAWIAAAVHARNVGVAPHRGPKGVRVLESDADVLLRALLAFTAGHDAVALDLHLRWFARVTATRPRGDAALAATIDTCAEALLRWFGPRGADLAARLLDQSRRVGGADVRSALIALGRAVEVPQEGDAAATDI